MENLLNKNNVLDFYNLNDDLNILNIILDIQKILIYNLNQLINQFGTKEEYLI